MTIGWFRRSNVLWAMGMLAVAAPMLGQETAAGGTLALAYDVVTIKPDMAGGGSVRVSIDNYQYKATNVTLKRLIQNAWHMPTEDLVSGLPGWAGAAHFDVQAKVDAATIAELKKLPPAEREMQSERMMQALLEDRFQIKVHHEVRELPIFQLSVAKGGAKMKETTDDSGGRSLHTDNHKLTVTDLPMAGFSQYLSEQMHRKVEDKTGLQGHYDFTLQWSVDETEGGKVPEFPALMTALQEQLGLRLDSAKGPVDTLVVDHVEQPTEN